MHYDCLWPITAGISHLLLNMPINSSRKISEHWHMENWKTFDKHLPSMNLSHFSSLRTHGCIQSEAHWNALLHSEWVNLYVAASWVGSLICLWLQRGLRHASCPCSPLINGSGEREGGGKVCVCVCARPRQRLWGFLQLNYIKGQSPADTHPLTYSPNKYGYAQTHTLRPGLMNVTHFLCWVVFVEMKQWWCGKRFLFRLRRQWWLPVLPLWIRLLNVSCVCCTKLSFCLFHAK